MATKLRGDPADRASPREVLPPCAACGDANWREFFRLTSLHDRAVWMDRNVPGPARDQGELLAIPSVRRSDPTQV
jgi:hypothetical protein